MGNYKNAYLNKQPNAVDPSEWINKQEEIGLYHDQLRQKREQGEADRKNKQDKETFNKTYTIGGTGNATFDEISTMIGFEALPKILEAKNEATQARDQYGMNSEQHNNAVNKYNNLHKTTEILKNSNAVTIEEMNGHKTLLDTNEYVDHPDNTKALDNFASDSFGYSFNDQGLLNMKKGGVRVEGEKYSGLNLKQPFKKLYAKDIAEGLSKIWGKQELQTRKGYIDFTDINSIEDSVDPKTGKKTKGLRSNLLDYFESNITDEEAERFYATEKNEFRESDGKKVSDDVWEKKKVDFINHLVESTIPLIDKEKGQKFDTSARNQDIRTANSKSDNDNPSTSGISFVETVGDEDKYAIDSKNTNTNKSARPESYKEVVYNRKTNTLSIKREKYVGDTTSLAFEKYEQAVKDQNDAQDRYNKAKEGSPEKQELGSSYYSKIEDVKVRKEALSKNTSDWVEDSITDKTKITTILSKELGLKNYPDILNHFKGEDKDTTSELPDINELPDLP